jgi:hypothetical protein
MSTAARSGYPRYKMTKSRSDAAPCWSSRFSVTRDPDPPAERAATLYPTPMRFLLDLLYLLAGVLLSPWLA